MQQDAPTHHVDTSVFIEALTAPGTEAGRDCERYLRRLGKIYKWVLTEPLLSEFYLFVLQKEKKEDADRLHDFFWFFCKETSPAILPPESGWAKTDYAQSLDSRISFLDCLHLGNATDNCKVFVTLDEKLLGNIVLEQRLGLKILHPADLI